jgi:hypothetical protein
MKQNRQVEGLPSPVNSPIFLRYIYESNDLTGSCVCCETLVGCSFREFLKLPTSVL